MSALLAELKQNPARFAWLFAVYNRLFGGNHFRVAGGNTVHISGALLRRCHIIIEGRGNTVRIAPRCRLTGCTIRVRGRGNSLALGEHCNVSGTRFCLEDDGNAIALGAACMLVGPTELAATEGTALTLGDACMFSADTDVRTGDSHAVCDASGARLNVAADVRLGTHVWLGNRAMVLKGVQLAAGCIVGAGSVVTHSCAEENCVLAGNPAKMIRRGAHWTAER